MSHANPPRSRCRRPALHPLALAGALLLGPALPAGAGGVRFEVTDLAAALAAEHPELTGKSLAINSAGAVGGYVTYRDPSWPYEGVTDLVDRGFIGQYSVAPSSGLIDNRVTALSETANVQGWTRIYGAGPGPSRYNYEGLHDVPVLFTSDLNDTSTQALDGFPVKGFSPAGGADRADDRFLVVGTLTNAQGHRYAATMNVNMRYGFLQGGLEVLGVGQAALRGSADAVNQRGWITGSGMTADGRYQAYLYRAAGDASFLGTLGGDHSAGHAISASGLVVGSAAVAGTAAGRDGHPFMFDGTRMIDLDPGAADGSALGVNDSAQVVGRRSADGAGYSAFLYSPSGGMQAINNYLTIDAPTYVAEVAAINGNGQIAATGYNQHPLKLTPRGSLSWIAQAGGATSDAAHWDSDLGFAPVATLDVFVNPGTSQRVVVDGNGVQARTFTLGGSAGAQVTLDLNGRSIRLDSRVSSGLVIRSGGTLTGSGVVDNVINRGGTVLLSGQGPLDAHWVHNHGVVTGSGSLLGGLTNFADGNVHVYKGQAMTVAGMLVNHSGAMIDIGGALSVSNDATNETNGAIAFDGGGAQFDTGLSNAGWVQIGRGGGGLSGSIVNLGSGRIEVAAGAELVVGGPLRNDGLLLVGPGGRAVLRGAVSGSGRFGAADGGTVRFEGYFTPDASAGTVHVGPADIAAWLSIHASSASAPVLSFEGALHLGAGSQLTLLADPTDAYAAGEAFHLFTYAVAPSGHFDRLRLPRLADGLVWDTAALYSQGTLQITAVPEPASAGMLAAGLGLLVAWRRRQTRQA